MSLAGAPITFGQERGSDYPRAIVTSDGSLLATYACNDGTTAKIVTKTGSGQGAGWTAAVTVISWDAKKAQLKNPYLLQTSSGAFLCAYLLRLINDDVKPWQFNLDISQSDDGGQSWYKIGSIVSERPGHGIQGEWEPFLRESPGGILQAYYSHEFSPSDQDIVFRTSSNGGKTWGALVTIAGAGVTNVRPGMPQVCNLNGQRNLLMVYESNAGGHFKVWAQTSVDGGSSWEKPHIIFDPGQGQAGGPGLAQLPGLLVVSFMTNQDQPHQPYNDVANLDMKVIASGDGGATWSQPVKALSQAGWGGVTAVEGGVLVLGATSQGTAVLQKVIF